MGLPPRGNENLLIIDALCDALADSGEQSMYFRSALKMIAVRGQATT